MGTIFAEKVKWGCTTTGKAMIYVPYPSYGSLETVILSAPFRKTWPNNHSIYRYPPEKDFLRNGNCSMYDM